MQEKSRQNSQRKPGREQNAQPERPRLNLPSIDLKKLFLAVGIILVLFNLGPCLPRSEVAFKLTVRKSLRSLPYYVARDQGYIEKSGLPIEVSNIQDPAQVIEGLMDGSLMAATALPVFSVINSELKNPGCLRISHLILDDQRGNSNALIVRQKSDIYKPKQLAGKTIAVLPGRANVVFAKLALRAALPANAEFRVVEIPLDAQLKALYDRHVHAILAFEPMISMALAKGENRVLIEDPIGTFVVKPMPLAVGVVSTKALKERPKQVRRYVKMMDRAMERIRANGAEAKRVGMMSLRADLENVDKMSIPVFVRLRSIGEREFNCVQRFANVLYEEKVISQPLHVRGLFMKSVTVPEH